MHKQTNKKCDIEIGFTLFYRKNATEQQQNRQLQRSKRERQREKSIDRLLI